MSYSPHRARAASTPTELSELFEGHEGKSYTIPILPPETPSSSKRSAKVIEKKESALSNFYNEIFQPSTVVGGVVFLLYHLVFCMAQASAITRPNATGNTVGPLAKMASIGIIFASPLFIFSVGNAIPAVYPTSDLFLAPFFAQIAVVIDEELAKDGLENDDVVFLTTFTAITSVALLTSGLLAILASVVKLANLGAFLPYTVLCGFFSTIGLLMYTLAFSIDTGGMKVGQVLFSNDREFQLKCLIHHLPSFLVGTTMHYAAPKNPFYVLFLVMISIILSYLAIMVTGSNLEEARNEQWFWRSTDLEYESVDQWDPPTPCGLYHSLHHKNLHMKAFKAGIPTVVALAFLYLIRCSLHAAALKKNIPNLTRKTVLQSPLTPSPFPRKRQGSANQKTKSEIGNVTLQKILATYGISQVAAAITGGLPIAPAVAASMTLFKLKAEATPPQYFSCLLVGIAYLRNFDIVGYIPKPAFSCLLVLAFLDMSKKWLIESFFNTRNKYEWAVAPVIVIFAFTLGLLNAIIIGLVLSIFIFVASFYRVGVVKFLANGLTLRSTIERNTRNAELLDQNGDLIQVCVLQGYVFFGNANSVLSYISSMFDEEELPDQEARLLPPLPKHLIIDLTIVSGLDTSAIDLFREIVSICTNNRCRLYLTGLSPDLKASLLYAGVKGKSTLSYVSDMDIALGQAEDTLLTHFCKVEEYDRNEAISRRRTLSYSEDGFRYALKMIDQTHFTNFEMILCKLEPHTIVVELKQGENLFQSDNNRGFYFIEFGRLRIQRDASVSTVEASMHSYNHQASIGQLNARSPMIGKQGALIKNLVEQKRYNEERTFRLTRIGPGWVVGSIEGMTGMRSQGVTIAITPCRLHLLPYHKVKELEEQDPFLVLNLLKMISHLGAKRQERTIMHLSNLFRILNSPAPLTHGKIERMTLSRLQNKF